MAPRTRWIAALLGGVAVLAIVGIWLTWSGNRQEAASASWPPAVRGAFMRSCIEQCQKSPGVNADKYPLCDQACACAADEGEKIMTNQELDATAQAMSTASASPEQTAKMDRLKAAGARCVAAPAPASK